MNIRSHDLLRPFRCSLRIEIFPGSAYRIMLFFIIKIRVKRWLQRPLCFADSPTGREHALICAKPALTPAV